MTQIIPAVARIRLNPGCTLDARSAENIVEYLYKQHRWDVLARRFRIRGSELDLAVVQQRARLGRIVEVKLRTHLPKIDFESTRQLLTTKKIAAIKRGASALNDKIAAGGLHVSWSFDVALVVPDRCKTHCFIYTWENAAEL